MRRDPVGDEADLVAIADIEQPGLNGGPGFA